MQWTSEYIRIWFWPRAEIPLDVTTKSPDPGSWGLPTAELAVGNCTVDEHFQQHKIIFDTTFCGEYAGNPSVWASSDSNSCAARTGVPTCDAYVATNPQVFADAYWEINSVRVYQLADPSGLNPLSTPYIASQHPQQIITTTITASSAIATLNLDSLPTLSTADLCSRYSFSIISDGDFKYEIACGVNPPGPDITYLPYAGFQTKSLADCIKGCSYYNLNNGTNICGAVVHDSLINFCYFKRYIDAPLVIDSRYNEVRLIYYGYPEITDNPSLASQTSSSAFVATVPVPQTYRPLTATSQVVAPSTIPLITTSRRTSVGIPALGNSSTPALSASSASNYSQTAPLHLSTSEMAGTIRSSSIVTSTVTTSTAAFGGAASATSATSSLAPSSTSTSVLDGSFYLSFNQDAGQRLTKRSLQYLAFTMSDTTNQALQVGLNVGYLTPDQSTATVLRRIDGILMTIDGYFVDIVGGPSLTFTLNLSQPANPPSLSIDLAGLAHISNIQGYCEKSNRTLLLISTGQMQIPDNCVSVTIGLIVAKDDVPVLSQPTGQMTILPTQMSSMSRFDGGVTAGPLETIPIFTDQNTRSTGVSATRTTILTGSPSLSVPLSVSRPSTTSFPPSASSFTYAGCFGITGPVAGVVQAGSATSANNNMTIEYCAALCLEQPSIAYYMAVHDFQCFCGTQQSIRNNLLAYPDTSCNIPCPGNASQSCGGDVEAVNSSTGTTLPPTTRPDSPRQIRKRQAVLAFISLYNNTSGNLPSSLPPLPLTRSATIISTELYPTPTSFPASLVSYNVTATSTITVLSTTYVDTCDLCAGGLTTLATTITLPVPADCSSSSEYVSPTIPMTTTAKTCRCGGGSSQSGAVSGMNTVILTVPHTSAIASMQSQFAAILLAPSLAAAGAPTYNTSLGSALTLALVVPTGLRGMNDSAQTLAESGPQMITADKLASSSVPALSAILSNMTVLNKISILVSTSSSSSKSASSLSPMTATSESESTSTTSMPALSMSPASPVITAMSSYNPSNSSSRTQMAAFRSLMFIFTLPVSLILLL